MDRGLRELGLKSVEELGAGPKSEKAITESIRAKTLEFEREREAYIDAAKQFFSPPAPPPPTLAAAIAAETEAAAAAAAAEETPGGEDLGENDGTDTREQQRGGWDDARDGGHDHYHHQQQQQGGLRPPRPGVVAPDPETSGTTSVREAREERRVASEEIRTLQHRKADAKVGLQAERLSNLEHGLELGVLRLERLLDRDRILELLRLTDPNHPSAAAAVSAAAAPRVSAFTGGRGEGGGGVGDAGEAEVSEELIRELEERVAEAEERVRVEAAKVGGAVAGRLEERARREENSRREESLARDEVVRLQTALRGKEERLANTVVSYLELRHAMLRAQRVASEARQDAATGRGRDEEEMTNCRSYKAEQTRAITERVDKTCEGVGSELRRQIQLREDEACMLREQRAEVEELYEERAVRLESMLEEWKTKHAALRRRFSLETEGFRRDADNIGRRFERIRAGPRGGRPAISSRSGSSARHAVERAIYSGESRGAAAAGIGGGVGPFEEGVYR